MNPVGTGIDGEWRDGREPSNRSRQIGPAWLLGVEEHILVASVPLGDHRDRTICCQPTIVLPRAHSTRERGDQHVGGGRAEGRRQVCEYGLGQFRIEFDGHRCGRGLTERSRDVETRCAESDASHPVVELVVGTHRGCQRVVPGSGGGHL
ncbi:Uncharacterised protein [Mycobacteroides abscessus subsp. abscessus]|nr:Uncharacterised protein [Mycobacteroides abscessus subsp. abscessus]